MSAVRDDVANALGAMVFAFIIGVALLSWPGGFVAAFATGFIMWPARTPTGGRDADG